MTTKQQNNNNKINNNQNHSKLMLYKYSQTNQTQPHAGGNYLRFFCPKFVCLFVWSPPFFFFFWSRPAPFRSPLTIKWPRFTCLEWLRAHQSLGRLWRQPVQHPALRAASLSAKHLPCMHLARGADLDARQQVLTSRFEHWAVSLGLSAVFWLLAFHLQVAWCACCDYWGAILERIIGINFLCLI